LPFAFSIFDLAYIMQRISFETALASIILFTACSGRHTEPETRMFTILDRSVTGIEFANNLDYTEEVNTYTFRNFYNGGGVGLADFNNDSLVDIFFAGNLVDNKLYVNKGDFHFEDVSETSGVIRDSWTTGVSIVDINADGLLDIYLCKSGPPGGKNRHNELLINNGDLTFTERSAEYGLDFEGLSVHAAFFDCDRDGDLDCYILNNSIRSVGGYDLRKDQRNIPDSLGGNKLLRNDGGKFIDVTQASGIYSSAIGFGLGVTIGDVDGDDWPDIYVSNDFFEKDYLYINNHDGTFREALEDYIREISLGSMGADMADINNDGLPEIFVTEMLPETDERLKTTSQFENWDKYARNVEQGYYRQFSRNVLQLNNGDGTFSEIGRFARVEATDWSWGALIFDMDNDGWKDIFVANGIYKDLINQDYVNFVANQTLVRQMILSGDAVLTRLIDSIPSNKLPNYAFHNNGDLTFTNRSEAWGLGDPSHSNGSAYADLDNDGDLDLVVSNVNMPAYVIRNNARELHPQNGFLTVHLQGGAANPFAVGSKITLITGGNTLYAELAPMRGFMSTVDYRLHFGLGETKTIDTLQITWPDGTTQVITQVQANQMLRIRQNDNATPRHRPKMNHKTWFQEKTLPGLDFVHRENDYSDFDRDRLLFHMRSNEGPCLCSGDVNGDGMTDFYIGGARGQAGRVYVSDRNGRVRSIADKVFDEDADSEDTGCVFFDANGDGRDDLYVASGGSEFTSNSSALRDRLYFSTVEGGMSKSGQLLPTTQRFESTSAVTAADVDGDGDIDLFVGVRLIPFLYGVPANGYILLNDGKGQLTDATAQIAPGLKELGLITAAQWADVNSDMRPDLIVVGEWMPIRLFLNQNGKLIEATNNGLQNTEGWYHALAVGDFNGDGLTDFVTGNHGLNSRFRASEQEPITLYVNDFDQNGSVEQILTQYNAGKPYPMVLRQDLVSQLPALRKKYLHYRDYAGQMIQDIFTSEQLERALVLNTRTLESSVWLNAGDGSFTHKDLPPKAQFSPVYAILVRDFNGDGNADILMGGNLCRSKPEAGIYDASYGLVLEGNGNGEFTALSARKSGLCAKGELRAFTVLVGQTETIIGARNNDAPIVLGLDIKKQLP
jgi:hypothetical protein